MTNPSTAANVHPVIGVSLDLEPAGGYAAAPWYAIRQNYCQSLSDAGGLVVGLAYQQQVDALLDVLDGVCLSGGGFDISPELFGETTQHPLTRLKTERTAFERALLLGALDRDMPILGICGGQQLMAAVLGARLIQHIPDAIADALEHSPQAAPGHPVGLLDAHDVRITPGSLLQKCCESDGYRVNSSHHQAVSSSLPSDARCVINATAPDGVVEGIEAPDYRFCLGVQWHPEYQKSAEDRKLMQAFVDACGRYSAQKLAKG